MEKLISMEPRRPLRAYIRTVTRVVAMADARISSAHAYICMQDPDTNNTNYKINISFKNDLHVL